MAKSNFGHTNDSILLQHLNSLFQVRAETPRQALEQLGERDWLEMPFDLGSVRVMYERLAVVHETCFPKRGSWLPVFLAETPDEVVLVTDAHIPGKQSLYFSVLTADRNVAISWLRAMTTPSVCVGSFGPDFIVSAPATAFTT